ncbi:MAG: biopolymer transporter ExbD [Pseudomonadota bacterium]
MSAARPSLRQRLDARETARIDLSPLIDIVFILLIFFIVSTVFVREAGVEVDKPEALASEQLTADLILIAITADGSVVYGGTTIGVSGVQPALRPLLSERSDQTVVVQADRRVQADLLVRVIDQAKLAGAASVHLATQAAD